MMMRGGKFEYEEIFALYLIDMADICQDDEVIEAINLQKSGFFDSLQFYKVM